MRKLLENAWTEFIPFLCLVTRSLDSTGRSRARWVTRWKASFNAFAITFEGRIN